MVWLRIVWGILLGTAAFAVFIAAYKRKGRVAFVMLPWVLWTLFMPLKFLLVEPITSGLLEQELGVSETSQRLAIVRLIFETIPNIIWPIVWFLPLILIFRNDKPNITVRESMESGMPS